MGWMDCPPVSPGGERGPRGSPGTGRGGGAHREPVAKVEMKIRPQLDKACYPLECYNKKWTITNIDKDVEKLKSSYISGGNIKWYKLFRNKQFLTVKYTFTCEPAIYFICKIIENTYVSKTCA